MKFPGKLTEWQYGDNGNGRIMHCWWYRDRYDEPTSHAEIIVNYCKLDTTLNIRTLVLLSWTSVIFYSLFSFSFSSNSWSNIFKDHHFFHQALLQSQSLDLFHSCQAQGRRNLSVTMLHHLDQLLALYKDPTIWQWSMIGNWQSHCSPKRNFHQGWGNHSSSLLIWYVWTI